MLVRKLLIVFSLICLAASPSYGRSEVDQGPQGEDSGGVVEPQQLTFLSYNCNLFNIQGLEFGSDGGCQWNGTVLLEQATSPGWIKSNVIDLECQADSTQTNFERFKVTLSFSGGPPRESSPLTRFLNVAVRTQATDSQGVPQYSTMANALKLLVESGVPLYLHSANGSDATAHSDPKFSSYCELSIDWD